MGDPTESNPESSPKARPTGRSVLDARVRVEWDESPEKRRLLRATIWCGVGSVLLAAAAGSLGFLFDPGDAFPKDNELSAHSKMALTYAGFALVGGVMSSFLAISAYRNTLVGLVRDRVVLGVVKREVDKAENELAAMSTGSILDLASLWTVNHKRLDYYHELATRQADASFRRAQLAMNSGFVILGVAILLSFLPTSTSGSVSVIALGTLASVLSGYVSGTYIRSQEKASINLRGYFEQPLEFSRYLIAERLLENLPPERRAQGILAIVEGIAHTGETQSQPPPEANEQ